MKPLIIFILFIPPLLSLAQKGNRYPSEVQAVLDKAGNNRTELEKAIGYFEKSGDSLKIKAIRFLIANMDIHFSSSYYWADSSGRPVSYNELDYPDFTTSLKAFEEIKKRTPAIHPVPVRYKDIDSIKADLLIENVEQAFEVWQRPWAKDISFSNFCEYILPYRISMEPLQNWRNVYRNRFAFICDSARGKTTEGVLSYFVADFNKWFTNTYGIESRSEPLPRLGALQLLQRKKGPCEDIAGLEVFNLRSQGIPASIDEVPYWATSSGRHFLNVAFTEQMKPLSFDVSSPTLTLNKLAREPAKVIRTTYSKQPNSLAAVEAPENIPEGFLRRQNYVDVTSQYWLTSNVRCELFPSADKPKVAYACVFNFLDWRPAWWGSTEKDSVGFTNMCKGAVFLPMYYIKGKLRPAGYPVASGYNNTMILKPDTINTHNIHLTEKEGYVVFRPGKRYRLFYWNDAWKALGEKTAEENTKELVFDRVPKNALLLLLPEYSQRKERPFVITGDGNRLWW
jgi:hypothetical protein